MKYLVLALSAFTLAACGSNDATPVPNDNPRKVCTPATEETPEICICFSEVEETPCPE